jgi:hypothetical protein
MKVVCRANTGEALCSRTRTLEKLIGSDFSLEIGRVCTVYGMHDWKGILEYLVIGTAGGYPLWYPAELFSVVDHSLPSEWHFRYVGNEDGILALWGYEELVMSTEHHDRLVELEPDALDVFVKRMPIAESKHQA